MQQLKVTRKFDCSGARVIGVQPNVWGAGKVYFVDSRSWGVGSNGNSGLDPDQPLYTGAAAYAKCTSGKHDYIVYLDGYDNDTTTMTIAKTGLHIIGVDGFNHRAPFVWLSIGGDGDAAVFTLQGSNAANVEIAGFTLGADTDMPCITTVTGGSTELVYAHIHHVAFAATGDTAFVAQDGILVAAGTGLDGTLIEDCTFGDEITRSGIRFSNFYMGMIRHNLFDMCGTSGVISASGGGADGMPEVVENFFRADHGASEGWAVNCGTCTNGLIAHNIATSDFDTSGANPYLDTADGNQWAMNYQWDEVMAPATT